MLCRFRLIGGYKMNMAIDQTINESVYRYAESWITGDASLLDNCLDGGSSYFDSALNKPISGNELGRHIRKTHKLFPDIEFSVEDCICSRDNKYVLEISMCATNLEALFGNKPSGKRTRITSMDVLTLESDKIHSIYSYYDLSQFEFAGQHDETEVEGQVKAGTAPKYKRSGLSGEKLAYFKERLIHSMEQEQLFLNCELTLTDIARHLGVRPNHVSQVINSQFGMNFHHFLNHYRVDMAKQLLIHDDYQDSPIVNVAYDSGFNSMSTFYSAFGKFAGAHPVEFKNAHRNNA